MNFTPEALLKNRKSLEDLLAMLEKGEVPARGKYLECGLLPTAPIEQVRKALIGSQKMIELHHMDPTQLPRENPAGPQAPRNLSSASAWW